MRRLSMNMKATGTQKNILLVDDDELLLDLYARKFEMNGFSVTKFMSSADALERLRSGATPDVLVLDLIMPDLDGYGLLETIQKEHLAPGAIKIVLSNKTEDRGIERAQELGIDGYIAKASSVPSQTVESILAIMSDLADRKT